MKAPADAMSAESGLFSFCREGDMGKQLALKLAVLISTIAAFLCLTLY